MDTSNQNIAYANIIKELGLENLSDDEKLDILSRLSTLVQKRVMVRILDTLSDEQKDEMGELLEKQSENADALTDWLSGKVENLPGIVEQETNNVKTELLDEVKV